METFSVLLALCEGNSPVVGELPSQKPVTQSFDVFFDMRLNKRLSKPSRHWWFETPLRSVWRYWVLWEIYSRQIYSRQNSMANPGMCFQGSTHFTILLMMSQFTWVITWHLPIKRVFSLKVEGQNVRRDGSHYHSGAKHIMVTLRLYVWCRGWTTYFFICWSIFRCIVYMAVVMWVWYFGEEFSTDFSLVCLCSYMWLLMDFPLKQDIYTRQDRHVLIKKHRWNETATVLLNGAITIFQWI